MRVSWPGGEVETLRSVMARPDHALRDKTVMHYVYVLKGIKDNRIYIGFSSDLKSRLKRHNSGKVKSTQFYKPWQLVYYEAFKAKKDATKREKQLKMHAAKDELKGRLKYSLEA
jgi:putative endonuclease